MISRRTMNTILLTLAGLQLSKGQASMPAPSQNPTTQPFTDMPAIGMGTWITFDVNQANQSLQNQLAILNAFFEGGGQMIDSSPMYGFAQQVLGQVLPTVQNNEQLFSATKVWTMGQQNGVAQMRESMKLWGLGHIDLMQIHNMLDWQTHLPTLLQWKKEGLIKHIGITTSHGRRHQDLIKMLQSHPVDCVQFTYNIDDREAEKYLLPLAQDLGVGVIINRPFQTGGLFARVKNAALPSWAKDIQCENWAQLFLKFIISHPAVTCAIPATSQVKHMNQNMQALKGDMPDQAMRTEMVKYYESIT